MCNVVGFKLSAIKYLPRIKFHFHLISDPSPVSSSGSLEMHKKVNTRYCNQIFDFFRLICGLQFHRFQLDSSLFDDKSQTHIARGSSSSSKHPLASTPSLSPLRCRRGKTLPVWLHCHLFKFFASSHSMLHYSSCSVMASLLARDNLMMRNFLFNAFKKSFYCMEEWKHSEDVVTFSAKAQKALYQKESVEARPT